MSDSDEQSAANDVVPPPSSELAHQLLAILRLRWESHTMQPRVVGIAGESGSGKSHLADSLASVCSATGVRVLVLNADNYFLLPPRTNHEHRCESLANVGPHEVNLALLADHVSAFCTRASNVDGPLVDYPGNRFVTQRFDFSRVDLLIVEGTYVLQLDGLDARVFMAATRVHNEERRRARNRDIVAPIIDEILAIEHAIIAPMAALADIVVDSEFRIVRS